MKSSNQTLELSEEQALFFRARRGFLTGGGAENPAQCARELLGLQSQQLAPGLLALSQRLASRPKATDLEKHLFGPIRDLVRTWGQRDTIHIYDAQAHWAQITSARNQWSPGGRRGALPSPQRLQDALGLALDKGLVLRKDFLSLIDPEYLAEMDPRIGDDSAKTNFGCGRLVWLLSLAGHLCMGEKQGPHQIYATRRLWFPKLEWAHSLPGSLDSCIALARQYLKVNAPATAQDLGHYFGAKVSTTRKWLAVLEEAGELIGVDCGGRKGLVALACDAQDLQLKPGQNKTEWPVRLLPLWDTLLMSHRDKSWTVPEASEHPLVWRKAAYVSSVVLARGRVVAVWKMKRQGKNLNLELEPLKGWIQAKHLAGFRSEAEAVARHLEMEPGVMP